MSEATPYVGQPERKEDFAGLTEADTWQTSTLKLLRSLYLSKAALFAATVLCVMTVLAIFANMVIPHGIRDPDLVNRLAPPIWSAGGVPEYLLGTDHQGRDILSRLIYAARISLMVAVLSVIVGGGVGISIGVIAGYVGGKTESFLMRVGDLQLAFPSLFLGLVVMGLIGAGVTELVFVIALTQWAYYARVTRGEVLRLKKMEFVQGARAVGASHTRIIFLYIIPNLMSSVIVVATFSLAIAIYYEAALSFFGLGVPPDIPTWGNMLSQARDHMIGNFWYPVLPGVAITLTVLSFNLLGDWIRDYLDVKISD